MKYFGCMVFAIAVQLVSMFLLNASAAEAFITFLVGYSACYHISKS
jgi:hypothetical protein